MKRTLVLFSLFVVLLFSGCDAAPEDSSVIPGDTVVPAVEDTAVPLIEATPEPTRVISTADFDYYVLALSWAPDYCSANPGDTQECSPGKKYAFVLHGLWPQYTQGYPSDCSSDPLPKAVKAQFPRLYPSDKLFEHEWSKHGTCSGLSPADYMTLAGQIKNQVQIPADYRAPAAPFRTTLDELKQAFLEANPDLSDTDLVVRCSGSGRFLSELYLCFSIDGQPGACGADVRKSALKSCPNADFLVRSVQ